jgi:hypothetical protein
MHPTAYTIAQHCSRIGKNAFIQNLPFPVGKVGTKELCLKSQSSQEIKYTQVPTTCYCMTNMTVVGAFLSWHKQLSPISAQECCKIHIKGWGGLGGACKLKFTRFASSNI